MVIIVIYSYKSSTDCKYIIYIQFKYIYNSIKKKKTNKLKAHYLATLSFMLLNNLQAAQMLCNNNLRYKVYKVY